LRSEKIQTSEVSRAVETLLTSISFIETRGEANLATMNDLNLREALLPLLIEKDTAIKISGN